MPQPRCWNESEVRAGKRGDTNLEPRVRESVSYPVSPFVHPDDRPTTSKAQSLLDSGRWLVTDFVNRFRHWDGL